MVTAVNMETDQGVLKRFAALIRNGRLAHAYLFIGPAGIGKGATAHALARLMLCEHPAVHEPCGVCASCLKVLSGRHPDVIVVECPEDKESISIEQVREMIGRIQLRAFEGKHKVFIVRDIDRLTTEAGNALLKTLEEPVKDSLILLTTSSPEKCLDTVRSRCHSVAFFPSSIAGLALTLTRDYAIGEAAGKVLAYAAEGCAGEARRPKTEGLLKKRDEALHEFALGSTNDAYLKRVLSDRGELRILLRVLLGWLRDLWLIKTGAEDSRLINADRLDDLRRLSVRFSFSELDDAFREVVNNTRLLEENLNMKVAITILKEKLCPRS